MSNRHLVGMIVFAAAIIAAACGGGDDSNGNSGDVARDVEQAFEQILGDAPLIQVVDSYAEECREDVVGGLLLARGFIEELFGDADVGAEVTGVEFLADDRALVRSRILLNGEPSSLFGDDSGEAELWVRQDGRWRYADDCAFYGTASSVDDDLSTLLESETPALP